MEDPVRRTLGLVLCVLAASTFGYFAFRVSESHHILILLGCGSAALLALAAGITGYREGLSRSALLLFGGAGLAAVVGLNILLLANPVTAGAVALLGLGFLSFPWPESKGRRGVPPLLPP